MDILKIDGRVWDVEILGISESFNILYGSNTGRASDAEATMILDPIGSFFGHTVRVARKGSNVKEFDELFNYIAKPRRNGLFIEAVHDQTTISYQAYMSTGSRTVRTISRKTGTVYYDAYDIVATPMKAQVVAE